jgi:hypothetical protein
MVIHQVRLTKPLFAKEKLNTAITMKSGATRYPTPKVSLLSIDNAVF